MDKSILKIIVCGNVDDGKSTLLGRLLLDSLHLFENQVHEIKEHERSKSAGRMDLALFTDGLRFERARSITIDLAYRNFESKKHRFVLIDSPGHVEYLSKLASGMTQADAVLLLIDAQQGLTAQSKRILLMANLFNISNVIVCINKMDLLQYSEAAFEKVKNKILELDVSFNHLHFVPVSALEGDFVQHPSENMNWYKGPSLVDRMDALSPSMQEKKEGRFVVQSSKKNEDSLFIFGMQAQGTLLSDAKLYSTFSGSSFQVKSIFIGNKKIESVEVGRSVVLETNSTFVERGDVLCEAKMEAKNQTEFKAIVCWFGEGELLRDSKFIIKNQCGSSEGTVLNLNSLYDMESFLETPKPDSIHKNGIGRISISTKKPLFLESYNSNKLLGSIVLIDSVSNATIGLGLIESAQN